MRNDIDISKANDPKPELTWKRLIIALILIPIMPLGTCIGIFMIMSKVAEVKEWEKQVQLAASLGKLNTSNGSLKVNQ